ncbi:MAG: Wzz/FepE/Etk N-terminal domain-containing protein [Thermovirgaceae bacterium]
MSETNNNNENRRDQEERIIPVPVQYVYAGDDEDEISLLDLLAALARQKFLVFWITLVFFLGSIGITFLLTPQYKTSATVTSNVAGGQLVSLLGSRTVQDAVLDQFAPKDWRESTGLGKEMGKEELVSDALGEVRIEEDKGTIQVQVVYREPRHAAEVANTYVDVLKQIMKQRAVTATAERRLYFSIELEKARYKFAQAREEFESFQDETGISVANVPSLENIARRAELRASLDSKTIHLEGLNLLEVPSLDPRVLELKEEIPEIQKELQQINGRPDKKSLSGEEDLSAEQILEFTEKYHEMKYWEALHASLADLYERARIEDAMNPAVVQTLEKAVPPEKRFKPNRKLIVILATLLGFFIAVFSAFVAEFVRRASQDPEQEEKIRMIKEALNPMTYIRHVFRLRKK